MKKILPAVLLFIVLGATASCQKDYTCTCTYIDGAGIKQTITGNIHGTKSQAKSACDNNANDLKYIGTSVSCGI